MKMTVQDLQEKKRLGEKIVMLTCYDYPTALLEEQSGVDILLVGDSVGTNVLGYHSVSEVTVADMVHHIKAVCRGAKRSFILGDMPYGSFSSNASALETARRLIDAGADGVKMEGEEEVVERFEFLSANGVPLCAHIGYTPQTDGARARVQGKNFEHATSLIRIARRLQDAGACMMVLELIPELLAAEITRDIAIPTIGIGAGRYCDGQVQVIFDILGMHDRIFRHAKAFTDNKTSVLNAMNAYGNDVKSGAFPTEQNGAPIDQETLTAVKQWLVENRGK